MNNYRVAVVDGPSSLAVVRTPCWQGGSVFASLALQPNKMTRINMGWRWREQHSFGFILLATVFISALFGLSTAQTTSETVATRSDNAATVPATTVVNNAGDFTIQFATLPPSTTAATPISEGSQNVTSSGDATTRVTVVLVSFLIEENWNPDYADNRTNYFRRRAQDIEQWLTSELTSTFVQDSYRGLADIIFSPSPQGTLAVEAKLHFNPEAGISANSVLNVLTSEKALAAFTDRTGVTARKDSFSASVVTESLASTTPMSKSPGNDQIGPDVTQTSLDLATKAAGETTRFSAFLRIVRFTMDSKWNPNYADNSTTEYQTLRKNIAVWLQIHLRSFGYLSVEEMRFSPSPDKVSVEATVAFRSAIIAKDVGDALEYSFAANNFYSATNGASIVRGSLTVSGISELQTTTVESNFAYTILTPIVTSSPISANHTEMTSWNMTQDNMTMSPPFVTDAFTPASENVTEMVTTIQPIVTSTSLYVTNQMTSRNSPLIIIVDFRIDRDWSNNYFYSYTADFQKLYADIEKWLGFQLSSLGQGAYVSLNSISFSPGSIAVTSNLTFNPEANVTEEKVKDALRTEEAFNNFTAITSSSIIKDSVKANAVASSLAINETEMTSLTMTTQSSRFWAENGMEMTENITTIIPPISANETDMTSSNMTTESSTFLAENETKMTENVTTMIPPISANETDMTSSNMTTESSTYLAENGTEMMENTTTMVSSVSANDTNMTSSNMTTESPTFLAENETKMIENVTNMIPPISANETDMTSSNMTTESSTYLLENGTKMTENVTTIIPPISANETDLTSSNMTTDNDTIWWSWVTESTTHLVGNETVMTENMTSVTSPISTNETEITPSNTTTELSTFSAENGTEMTENVTTMTPPISANETEMTSPNLTTVDTTWWPWVTELSTPLMENETGMTENVTATPPNVTTASLNVTDTTEMTSQELPLIMMVGFSIDKEWNQNYSDSSSTEFQQLRSGIERWLSAELSDFFGRNVYNSLDQITFSNGSIVTTTMLNFNPHPNVTEERVLEALTTDEAFNNFTNITQLTLKPHSFTASVISPEPQNGTTPLASTVTSPTNMTEMTSDNMTESTGNLTIAPPIVTSIETFNQTTVSSIANFTESTSTFNDTTANVTESPDVTAIWTNATTQENFTSENFTVDVTSSFTTENFTSSENFTTISHVIDVNITFSTENTTENATTFFPTENATMPTIADNYTLPFDTENSTFTDNTTDFVSAENTTEPFTTENVTVPTIADNYTLPFDTENSTFIDNTTDFVSAENTTEPFTTENATVPTIADNYTLPFDTENSTFTDNTTDFVSAENTTEPFTTENATVPTIADNFTLPFDTENSTSTDNTTDFISAENTTEPFTTENATVPTIADNFTLPFDTENSTSTDNTTDFISAENTTEPFTTENATVPTIADNFTLPFATENSTSTDNTTDFISAENTTEPFTVENTTESFAVENTTEPFTFENTTERYTVENSTEAITENVTMWTTENFTMTTAENATEWNITDATETTNIYDNFTTMPANESTTFNDTTELITPTSPLPSENTSLFTGNFKITEGRNWTDDLANFTSPGAEDFSQELKSELTALFNRSMLSEYLQEVEVNSFAQGSIHVTYDVTFQTPDDYTITPDNVSTAFLESLNPNGTLPSGTLVVDRFSVSHKVFTPLPHVTTTVTSPVTLPDNMTDMTSANMTESTGSITVVPPVGSSTEAFNQTTSTDVSTEETVPFNDTTANVTEMPSFTTAIVTSPIFVDNTTAEENVTSEKVTLPNTTENVTSIVITENVTISENNTSTSPLVFDFNTTEPFSTENTTENITEVSTENTTENITEVSPENATMPTATDNYTLPFTTENSTTITENITEPFTTENTTEWFPTENSTEWFTTENDTEPFTPENTTEPFTTENTTEWFPTENSTEWFTTENGTEPFTTENTTEPFTTESTTERLTTENSTEWFTTENTTEPFTTENTTEPFITENSTETENITMTTPENITLTTPDNIPLTTPENVTLTTPENITLTTPENITLTTPENVTLTTETITTLTTENSTEENITVTTSPTQTTTTTTPVESTTFNETTELTTTPTTTPAVERSSFTGKFKIIEGRNWTDDLANFTSLESKELIQELESELITLYKRSRLSQYFEDDVTIISFAPGSILVTYVVTFRSANVVTPFNVNLVFLESLNDNYTLPSGRLLIERDSVSHQAVSTPGGPALALANWAIAVIVCGIVLLIFIIFLIIVLCLRRQSRQKYQLTDDPDDFNYRRSWASSSQDNAFDNTAAFAFNESSNGKQTLDNGRGADGRHHPELANNNLELAHVAQNSRQNGTKNGRALVYQQGNLMTFYNIDQDAWETHL